MSEGHSPGSTYRRIDRSDYRLREDLNGDQHRMNKGHYIETSTRSTVQSCDSVAVWEGEGRVNPPNIVLGT
jgi:hypothetical protein